jgi:phosphopantetheine adenylyltransferase
MRSSYSLRDERRMFDDELAHKNRQHDIRQARKRNSEVNKVIDLNEVSVTPRDHLSVPVAHAAGAPTREAVETVLVRSTETGARCGLFFKHQLRRRGFGISPSAVCPISAKAFTLVRHAAD